MSKTKKTVMWAALAISMGFIFCNGCNESLQKATKNEITTEIKEFSNVYLGGNIEDMQKNFRINSISNTGEIWKNSDYNFSEIFNKLYINVSDDKVKLISLWAKNDTEKHFNILKKVLKKEYQKYGIIKEKRLYKDYGNLVIGKEDGIEFEVIINEKPISIMLLFTYGSSAANDELTITFVCL